MPIMSGYRGQPAQDQRTDQQPATNLFNEVRRDLCSLGQSIRDTADIVADQLSSETRWVLSRPSTARTADELLRDCTRSGELFTLTMSLLDHFELYMTRYHEIERNFGRQEEDDDVGSYLNTVEMHAHYAERGMPPHPTPTEEYLLAARRDINNARQQYAGFRETLDGNRAQFGGENARVPESPTECLAERMGDQGPGVPVPFHETRQYAEETAQRLAEERWAHELRTQVGQGERLGDQGPGSPIAPPNARSIAVDGQRQVLTQQIPAAEYNIITRIDDDAVFAHIQNLTEEVRVLAAAAQVLRRRMVSQRELGQDPDPRLAAQLSAAEAAAQETRHQLAAAQNARNVTMGIDASGQFHLLNLNMPEGPLQDAEDIQAARHRVRFTEQGRATGYDERRMRQLEQVWRGILGEQLMSILEEGEEIQEGQDDWSSAD